MSRRGRFAACEQHALRVASASANDHVFDRQTLARQSAGRPFPEDADTGHILEGQIP